MDISEENDSGSDYDDEQLLQLVQMARSSMQQGLYRKSLAQYLNLIAETPAFAEVLENEVICVTNACVEEMIINASVSSWRNVNFLFQGVRRALPSSAALLCAEGTFFHRHAESHPALASQDTNGHLHAIRCFQQALKIDPRHSGAAESLENLQSFAAERWHFRMLNDDVRNACYDESICRAVNRLSQNKSSHGDRSDISVLDIGSGTGILSIMAARAGSSSVYACESNAMLCEIARETLTKETNAAFLNNSCNVRILNVHSSSLIVSQTADESSDASPCTLPQKVDLVVTELVDSGLVGEHMIQVLRHAKAELLILGGSIIPAAARLYAYPIECKAIRPRHRLLYDHERAIMSTIHTESTAMDKNGDQSFSISNTVENENLFYGFEVSSFSIVVDEKYTCENLSHFPHKKGCEEPIVALDMNFNELSNTPYEANPDIHNVLLSKHSKFQTRPDSSFEIDAIAVYFDLILDPGNQGEATPPIQFNTHPHRVNCGWDQGIYQLRDDSTNRLEPSTSYCLDTFLHANDCLSFRICVEGSQEHSSPTTGTNVSNKESNHIVKECNGTNSYEIGEMDMAALNNSHWQTAFANAVCSCVHGLQFTVPTSDVAVLPISVLELCGSFSLASLLAVKLKSNTNSHLTDSYHIRSYSSTHHKILKQIWEGNAKSFHDSAITCHLWPPMDAVTAFMHLKEASCTCGETVVVVDVIEGSGLIRQGALEEVASLMEYSLTSHQIRFIPSAIEVVVSPIECHWIETQNKVNAAATRGIDLNSINDFGVRLFRELPLHYLPHQLLSPPQSMKETICLEAKWGEHEGGCASVSNPLQAHTKVPLHFRIKKTGKLHGFAFWFNQNLVSETISTEPNGDSLCHFRQAAVALPHPLSVSEGQLVDVHVSMGLGVNGGIEMSLV